MKKKLTLLLLMVTFTCINVMSQLVLWPAYLQFNGSGGSMTVSVDYSGDWQAAVNPDITWISVYSDGSPQIFITATPNTGTEQRSYDLEFYNGKDLLGSLHISQDGPSFGCKDSTAVNFDPKADMHEENLCQYYTTEFTLTITDMQNSTVQIGAEGGNIPFSVLSTQVDWQANTSLSGELAGELYVNPPYASAYSQVITGSIHVQPNTTETSRVLNLVFESGDSTLMQIRINQLGIQQQVVYGCKDSTATNFDPAADVHQQNICKYSQEPQDVYGCTNSSALNYNPQATHDDGSCSYAGNPDFQYTIGGVENPGHYTAPTGGGNIPILIVSNVDWSVQIAHGGEEYSSMNPSQGSAGTTQAYITLQPNTGAKRDYSLDFYNQNLMSLTSLRITQYGTQETIYGCKDSTAINYDPTADVHDKDLCQYSTPETYGCKDSTATNYDPMADIHRQDICKYSQPEYIYGCTDPTATNYNPRATRFQPNSCIYADTTIVLGCTDNKASNYNANATINDGSCTYVQTISGCTDSRAINYNEFANVNNGTCRYDTIIWGCTDLKATNFNQMANKDNGYCTYAEETKGCTDKTATNYAYFATLEDGSCTYAQSTEPLVYGCTKPHAMNYNPYANVDNNTCILKKLHEIISGCTDPDAINYNAVAKEDNGSCVYTATTPEIYGCTDAMALNFNLLANMDDKSCVYSHPLNTFIPSIEDVPADTMGTKTLFDCQLNNMLPIDNAQIIKLTDMGNGIVKADWLIFQNNVQIPFSCEYKITSTGNLLFYLSILCDNDGSRAKATYQVSAVENSLVGYTVAAEYNTDNIVTSTKPVLTDNNIQVYPNPVKDILNVTSNENISVKFYSIEGQLQSVYGNADNIRINTSNLHNGVYLLQVTKSSGQSEVFKVIKR